MPQAIVYFDEIEDKIVEELSKKWKMSKAQTVKTLIRKYKEENNDTI